MKNLKLFVNVLVIVSYQVLSSTNSGNNNYYNKIILRYKSHHAMRFDEIIVWELL